jgi:pimeloyl-ACP methyl ester carboxylesterase
VKSLLAFLLLLVTASPSFAAEPTELLVPLHEVAQMEHVSIQATGSGQPLVLIPGLATPREVWVPFVAEFARTHWVLLVQVNGFGGDQPRGNEGEGILPGVVADIAAFLESEHPGQKAAVVGHSMGGVVGMMLARDHPERVDRLLVVDALPFFGSLFGPSATVETMRPAVDNMRRMIASGAGRSGDLSASDPAVATMSATPEGRLQVARWSRAANPEVVGQALYEDALTDLRPDLAAIARVPTTVLYAVPAEIPDRARALWTGEYAPAPAIRLVPVEDSMHFIMLDQPERFRTELRAFLAR